MFNYKEGDVVICNEKEVGGPEVSQVALVAAVEGNLIALQGYSGYFRGNCFDLYMSCTQSKLVYGQQTYSIMESLKHLKAWNDSHPAFGNISVEAHPIQEGGTLFILGDHKDTTDPMEFLEYLLDYQVVVQERELIEAEQMMVNAKLRALREGTLTAMQV